MGDKKVDDEESLYCDTCKKRSHPDDAEMLSSASPRTAVVHSTYTIHSSTLVHSVSVSVSERKGRSLLFTSDVLSVVCKESANWSSVFCAAHLLGDAPDLLLEKMGLYSVLCFNHTLLVRGGPLPILLHLLTYVSHKISSIGIPFFSPTNPIRLLLWYKHRTPQDNQCTLANNTFAHADNLLVLLVTPAILLATSAVAITRFLGGTRPGSADDDKIRQLFQSAINYSIPKDNYAQVEIIPQKFQFLS
ncbi:hypothetical protein FOCC_FOCC000550, partial [Frankliniella occidentalis]